MDLITAEHGIFEDRMGEPDINNHAYGRRVDDVDSACFDLSPKLKIKANAMRQRKMSRQSVISIITGNAPANISIAAKILSDVIDEDDDDNLTELDDICKNQFSPASSPSIESSPRTRHNSSILTLAETSKI